MVLDLTDGRKNKQWRLIDSLYDRDALDELPIHIVQIRKHLCDEQSFSSSFFLPVELNTTI